MPRGYTYNYYTSHGSHVVLCNYRLFRSNTFEQRYTVASWLLSNIDKRGGTGSLDWVGAESGVQRVHASSLDRVGAGPGARSRSAASSATLGSSRLR